MKTKQSKLEKKLAAYALTGAALLAPGTAHAGIVYNDIQDVTLTAPDSWDLQFNGTNGITFEAVTSDTPPYRSIQVSGLSTSVLVDDTSTYAQALAFGSIIDPSTGYWGSSGKLVGRLDGYGDSGVWSTSGDAAYLGFYFGEPGSLQAGWVYASTTVSDSTASVTVHSYAFQDTPNLTISAGDTGLGDVPEPSSMALIALGGAGLVALRRRRAANHA